MEIESKVSRFILSSSTSTDIESHPPGFIDMSFGNPSIETFPVAEIISAAQMCLSPQILQYCTNRGLESLISSLVSWMQHWQDVSPQYENIVITNGSMDAIAIIADTFVEPGDVVLAESPTYWRARDIFQYAGADISYVPIAEDGLDLLELASTLKRMTQLGERVKLIYTIPNHQNPTGTVMSTAKKRELLDLSEKYGFLILEDNVYTHLTYLGPPPPSLYSLSRTNRVIQIGTLSKLLCPGLRIGWLIAPKPASDYMLKIKKDGGTNPLASEIAAFLLNTVDWPSRFDYLRRFYHQRLEAMCKILSTISPELASWNKPTGGFYVWLRLGQAVSIAEFERACEQLQVGFMPGSLCTGEPSLHRRCIRLAFSNLSIEEIEDGVSRVVLAIRNSTKG